MSLDKFSVVILAGGFGTRIAEYSDFIPKPLVPVGGRPIIAHIIEIFAKQGLKSFLVAGGYKVEELKKYFSQYHLLNSDFKVNTKTGEVDILCDRKSGLEISIINTGLNTQTGGRLKRLEPILNERPFFLTYGDGVSNVNLKNLLHQHKQLKSYATITAVHPTSRYGKIHMNKKGNVVKFVEKPEFGEDWINGGFILMEPSVFKYLSNDNDVLETALLQQLAKHGKLGAYKHTGFWKSMDTLRDKRELDKLAENEELPWMDVESLD
ncbi:sugar phosphate nucleotidyltransferase [Rhodobacteraceae bacterium]|nr:sugar phosphate nucleotidyltransferase [Paracoccaceae bacterium]